jgi:hypothetical protein
MYDEVTTDNILQQGDIFMDLPWPDFDPQSTDLGEGTEADMSAVPIKASCPAAVMLDPSPGIIVSADCSVLRDDLIVFARIRPIETRYKTYADKNSDSQLEIRINLWSKVAGAFYLPPVCDLSYSFAVLDGLQTYPRPFVEAYKSHRVATLTAEAKRHLREKLAYFLTRYGSDPYCLTPDEIARAKTKGWL